MSQLKLFLFILPISVGAQPLSTLVDEALLHNREVLAAQKKYEAMQQRPAPVHAPAGFSRFYSFSERAPITGTWGDPRTATAEKGARFLAVQAEALAQAIRDTVLWSRPDPVWAPGRGQGTTAGKTS